jgi:L-iditol 2-dehydrogenase
MFAAMYYANDDVRIVELPIPTIRAGEILVEVLRSGICGSDVMEWYRKPKAPLVLGHEIAARVVEVGAGVDTVRVGDRVFVSHHVPCGECRYCKDGHETVCDTLRSTNFDPGGFAEFVRVPKINVQKGVFPIPREVSDDEAVFIEPLACVVRGQRRAGLKAGNVVLVVGSGVAGLLHVLLAKAQGAAKVIATDVVPFRRAAARRAGAHLVLDARDDVPSKVKAANGGRFADLVVTCTGAPSGIVQGMQSVDRGGSVLFFAPIEPTATVSIPFNALWREEVQVTSSYGGAPSDIREAIELLRSRRVEVGALITHRLPLKKAAEGFALVAKPQDSLKVILTPPEPRRPRNLAGPQASSPR